MAKAKNWTEDEVDTLRQDYPRMNLDDLVVKLGKSKQAIIRKAAKYPDIIRDKSFTYKASNRKAKKSDWEPEDLEILKKMYWNSTNEEMEIYFKKKIGAIKRKAIAENFPRDVGLAYARRKDKHNAWSIEEDLLLQKLFLNSEYSSTVLEEFQKKYPSRTQDAIESRIKIKKLYNLRSSSLKGEQQWSLEQDELLKQYYGKISDTELRAMIGRDLEIKHMQVRANKLGVNKVQVWATEEIEKLHRLFSKSQWTDLISIFQRNSKQIRDKANNLGLIRDPNSFWREGMWEEWEVDYLKENYPEGKMEDILQRLNRTYHRIQDKAHELQIQRVEKRYFSENLMGLILDEIFVDEYCENGRRYEWLRSPVTNSPMQLDRFYPEKRLAFEYDGKQHYDFDAFVGIAQSHGAASTETLHSLKEKFDRYQQNDKDKRKICAKLNIKLITIRYDDELSEEFIRSKI